MSAFLLLFQLKGVNTTIFNLTRFLFSLLNLQIAVLLEGRYILAESGIFRSIKYKTNKYKPV